MRINLSMNPYLFGCIILFVWWLIVFAIVRTRGTTRNRHEFWWGSFACSLLGFTEPIFVPEYWDPPSVLAYGRWDLESFFFCFFVGGISGVAPEWRRLRNIFQALDYWIWSLSRGIYDWFQKLTGAEPLSEKSDAGPPNYADMRRDNALLGAIFLGGFGFTAHLGLNVIYDAALTCVLVGVFIAWYRPRLRWQVWGGGIIFTVVYAVVLTLTGWRYPTFYDDHWNLAALSGIRIGAAPIEEYLFALTMGVFWAPLFESWRNERQLEMKPPPIRDARAPRDVTIVSADVAALGVVVPPLPHGK
jgi:Lycopene cyclase